VNAWVVGGWRARAAPRMGIPLAGGVSRRAGRVNAPVPRTGALTRPARQHPEGRPVSLALTPCRHPLRSAPEPRQDTNVSGPDPLSGKDSAVTTVTLSSRPPRSSPSFRPRPSALFASPARSAWLLPALVGGLAVLLAAALYVRFLGVHRYLWDSGTHDRNAH